MAPETGKAGLPTVKRVNGGTASWLAEADRMGRHVSDTVKYNDRFTGALPFKAWKVITAILTAGCVPEREARGG